MFFWVQNGLLTPRVPEVSRRTVPPVFSLTDSPGANSVGPEPEPQSARISQHLFQSPKEAYEEQKFDDAEKQSPLLFANQIMTSPVTTLLSSAYVEEARQLFLEKRFRHIPIVNERKQLVGILSDRDVLKSVSYYDVTNKQRISEIMGKRILSGNLQTEIRYAAKVMLDEKVGALPIVSNEGLVIGIITRTDLIRAMIKFPGFTLFA